MTLSASEVTSQLMRLGFTKNEARVYVTLLSLGPSNAGPLIRALSLHRQYIYSALDQLIERKLASFVLRRGRRVFQAASPATLVALESQRAALAQHLVPDLVALERRAEEKIEVHTHSGSEEFFNNLITVLHSAARSDGVVRVIGGASDEDFYRVVGPYYPRYRDEGLRLKTKKHLIAPRQASALFKARFAHESGNELRLIDGALTAPTYTRITSELVTIETYAPQILIIQIWNQSIARAYREHFQLLWRQAERFEPQS